MKKHIWILLVLLGKIVFAQNITTAEYYFDKDPGLGNGTPITISSPATTENINLNIPTTGLQPGVHYLYIRGKNANNMWSIILGREFLIGGASGQNIVNAEYYFDSDPGLGNGIALPSFSPSNVINLPESINTTGLNPGVHYLYVRALNDAGTWSIVLGREFLIGGTGAKNIVKTEYYFDSDPGVGNGTALPSFSPSNAVNLSENINTTGLNAGVHYLYVRAQNDAGMWSIVLNREFLIGGTAATKIVKTEYFYDTDPGVGNGTAVTPGFTAAPAVNSKCSLPTSPLTTGLHYLFMRAQNDKNMWSIVLSDTFRIEACAPIALKDSLLKNVSCYGLKNGSAIARPGGSGTFSYLWTDGEKTQTATSLGAGTYTVSVNAAGDCTATDSITITQPPPITMVADSAPGLGCSNSAWVVVSGGTPSYTYKWESAGQTTDTATNLCAGTYTAVVTDKNGCKDSVTITINLFTGIDELASMGLKLYPDPTNGVLNIAMQNTASFTPQAIIIYDVTGRKIMEEKIDANASLIAINVSDYANGTYYLKIAGEDNQKLLRFAVAR
ncbi:MAG: T9SS type A sorting domain-containing protein [Bacteroidia bacterium]